MRTDELRELARFLSIQVAWKDAAGAMRNLSDEALKAAVKARLPDGVDPSEALRMRIGALDERLVEPVTVVWGDRPLLIPLRLPQGSAAVDLDWTLKLEDGAIRSGRAPLGKTFALEEAIPHGYHVLQLAAGGRTAETFVISAPVKAPALGPRQWGIFLPLYAARAARSWGAGDLTDLQACRGWVNELGGGVVATLPLLAAFEDEPSPYSPVSRLFWNEMYLDPTRLPEWRVTDLHQNELLYLQNAQFVDYPRVIAEKRRVLEAMARRFTFDEEFQLFARRGAYGYAHFRAAQEEKDSANYHLYVQYRMSQQMREAADGARQSGAGLYLDFPLGVNPAGYDAWKYSRSFAKGVSVGSPPDLFFTKGQNWGFPPPDPDAIREQRHDYFRACIRHHVSHAGVLRIDHVMGLHRLFWIPEGAEARDGFYVRYPDEELYAIVVLEARRQACSVVGEDLGTVPGYVPRMMKKHGVGRMYVVQYEVKPDNLAPLADPARESVASINTHDMPTFAGFWGGKDIDERLELGLLTREGASEERDRRAQIRDSVMNLLKARGLLQDGGGDKRAIVEAILRFLARGPAELVLVNLEDLWLEAEPQNVPGVPERSWKRKLRLSLEQLRKDPEVERILRGVNEERKESMAVRRRKGSDQTTPPAAPAAPSAPEKKLVKRAVKAVVEKVRSNAKPRPMSLLTDQDIYLFNEGSHHNLWDKLGSHLMERDGVRGVHFAVWAPNAEQVSVIGDFNEWNQRSHQLALRGSSGIWEGFIPGVHKGTIYKYHIISKHNGYRVDKADPFAVHHETPPRTGSIVWDLHYEWHDQEWMANRKSVNAVDAPMTKYEVHLGSWRRVTEDDGSHRPMSYREIAEPLAQYARKMNFTHVELMPVMEHPFYGSWGYQVTGFFAPTSRFGTPQDFKYLVDVLHQNGVGVILDWVPSHFPTDEHGLAYFDGTHLYEHADPRLGFHPDWGSLIFNYGRNEVRSFLLSSALYWLGEYHADGLRFDAVASMLYLDYSRKQGEWIPNEFGGRENIDAISFLRRMNEDVYKVHPDVQTIAEESTAWPMVSRPTYVGGLGFGMKWDMGWMHDTLRYFANDPIHRRFHHNELTFRMMYAYTENFVLPLSHDEVVHGKGSLIGKMPGDEWQKFANLRLLFAHMYAQPGKKLIFMGGEFGQWREWNHDSGLDWHLLDHLPHAALQRWVEDLNHAVKETPALYELDMSPDGFDWIDCCDTDQSVMSFVRRSKSRPNEQIVVVLNFTPVPRHNYQVGLPLKGRWTEILNSDATIYGGSGQGNMGGVDAMPVPLHGRRWSAPLTLPPLGAVFLKSEVVVEEMDVDTA